MLKFLLMVSLLLFNNTDYITERIRFIRINNLYNQIVPMELEHIVYVIDQSYMYEIDPDLVFAIIYAESNFNPNAANKTSSAKGYGQIIRSTAESIAKNMLNIEDYNHNIHAFEPYTNLQMMVCYIRYCSDRSKGSITRLLKHYRGVDDQPYFRKVLSFRDKIKEIKENSK